MLGVVALAAFDVMPIEVSAVLGFMVLILTRCLNWKDAMSALSTQVILIIVASLAMGAALLKTGGADYIARMFVTVSFGAPPAVVLGGLISEYNRSERSAGPPPGNWIKARAYLATGDFQEALGALLGEEAIAGFSATTITRLLTVWQDEYKAWRKRSLAQKTVTYLWADGVTPRQSGGLAWKREDLGGDGTHPSQSGRDKVAKLLLSFFKNDPLARSWWRFGRRS